MSMHRRLGRLENLQAGGGTGETEHERLERLRVIHEEPRYVRFGKLPKGGRSRNQLTSAFHLGASVYGGTLIEPNLFRIHTSELSLIGLQGLIARAAQDAPALFVAGDEVGVGPDGEPLLRIEHARRVPRTTSLTSVEASAQPALSLWSDGPRDFSGTKKAPRRLQGEHSEYSPLLRFSEATIRSFYEPAPRPFGPPLNRKGRR